MRHELFIDGIWREGAGAEFASRDPVSGHEVWRGRAANAADVAEANRAARAAFPAWARTPREARVAIAQKFAALVEQRASDFADMIVREMGKAAWDARGEVASMVGKVALSVRAQAERAGAREEAAPFGKLALHHRPHGVLAVFGPFNFPGHLPNGHIVPALIAGNTLIFKPSEITPGVGAMMVEAWAEAGLPAGVLNLVQGARETGAALIDAEGLNGVLFTGSAQVGALIHRHFAGRPDVLLALEMGGNNPLIVWPPVDADAAANLIVHSAFVSSGQRCSCARRLILPEGAAGDSILAALKSLVASVRVGPPREDVFMGPLAHERAAASVAAFADDLVRRGAKAIVAPKIEGAFAHPSLIDVTGVDAPDEECFGPLLQIIRVRDLDEALARANATRFGLAGGLICDDPAVWARVEAELRAGVLNWNRPTTGASGAAPFGGPGLSGSLRPSAYYAADYAAYPVAEQIAPKAQKIPAAGLPT